MRMAFVVVLVWLGFCGTGEGKTLADERLSALTASARAAPVRHLDVDRFIAGREPCEHFRGEVPYDPARAAFLDREITVTCRGTDAALKKLRRKYRDNPTIIQRLYHYDNDVETVLK